MKISWIVVVLLLIIIGGWYLTQLSGVESQEDISATSTATSTE